MKSEQGGGSKEEPIFQVESSALEEIPEPKHRIGFEFTDGKTGKIFRVEGHATVYLPTIRDLKTGERETMTEAELDGRIEGTVDFLSESERAAVESEPKKIWDYGFKPGELVRITEEMVAESWEKEKRGDIDLASLRCHIMGSRPDMSEVLIDVFDEDDKHWLHSVAVPLEIFLEANKGSTRRMARELPKILS